MTDSYRVTIRPYLTDPTSARIALGEISYDVPTELIGLDPNTWPETCRTVSPLVHNIHWPAANGYDRDCIRIDMDVTVDAPSVVQAVPASMNAGELEVLREHVKNCRCLTPAPVDQYVQNHLVDMNGE